MVSFLGKFVLPWPLLHIDHIYAWDPEGWDDVCVGGREREGQLVSECPLDHSQQRGVASSNETPPLVEDKVAFQNT
jgi:hypothetical protein